MDLLVVFGLMVFMVGILVQSKQWGFLDLANPIVFHLNYHLSFLSLGVFCYLFGVFPTYQIESESIFWVLSSYTISVVSTVVWAVVLSKSFLKRRDPVVAMYDLGKAGVSISEMLVFWFLGVALTIIVAYKSGFSALLHTAGDFEDQRVLAVSGNGFLIIPAQILLLVSAGWLLNNMKFRLSIRIVIFFVSAACLLSFGFRSGLLSLVLVAVLFKIYLRDGKVSPLLMTLLAISGFVLLVALGVLRKSAEEDVIARFLASFLWRSFVTLYNFDVIYRNYSDYLLGGGLVMELGVLIPGPDKNLGAHLKESLGYDFAGGGITPSYIGAGFVDFGVVGIFLFPIVSALVVTGFSVAWKKIAGTSRVAFYFLLIFSVTTSGVSAAGILSPYLYFGLPLLVMIVIIRMVRSLLKSRGA